MVTEEHIFRYTLAGRSGETPPPPLQDMEVSAPHPSFGYRPQENRVLSVERGWRPHPVWKQSLERRVPGNLLLPPPHVSRGFSEAPVTSGPGAQRAEPGRRAAFTSVCRLLCPAALVRCLQP